MYKNIEKGKLLTLKSEVEYQTGQVVSKTLAQNEKVSLTLFSFDVGEEISSHSAAGDALITSLDGKATITISNERYEIVAGQSIIIPKDAPHAVKATEKFKMLLIVSY